MPSAHLESRVESSWHLRKFAQVGQHCSQRCTLFQACTIFATIAQHTLCQLLRAQNLDPAHMRTSSLLQGDVLWQCACNCKVEFSEHLHNPSIGKGWLASALTCFGCDADSGCPPDTHGEVHAYWPRPATHDTCWSACSSLTACMACRAHFLCICREKYANVQAIPCAMFLCLGFLLSNGIHISTLRNLPQAGRLSQALRPSSGSKPKQCQWHGDHATQDQSVKG